MIAHKKTRSTQISHITNTSMFGIFSMLIVAAVVGVSILANNGNQDIRRAAKEIYPTKTPTPIVFLPTNAPLPTLGENQCRSNVDCTREGYICIAQSGPIGNCQFFCQSDSQCSPDKQCRAGGCVPRPTVPPVVVNPTAIPTVRIVYVIPTAIPSKPLDTPVPETKISTAPIAQINPTSVPISKITLVSPEPQVIYFQTTGPKLSEVTPAAVQTQTTDQKALQTSRAQAPSSVKQTQQVAAQVSEVLYSTGSVKEAAPESFANRTITQFAQVVKSSIDNYSTDSNGSKAQSTSSFSTLSTTEVIKPQSYVPPSTVVEKVAQAAVSTAAFHDQSKSSGTQTGNTEIKMLVQSAGETRLFVIPVKTDQAGRIDQTEMQHNVTKAIQTPQSGILISNTVIAATQKAIAQGKVQGDIEEKELKVPYENGFTCLTGLVNCSVGTVTSKQLDSSIKALNEADVVVSVGQTAQLPTTKAHQVAVNFSGNQIMIDQKAPVAQAQQAIAFQFSPVIDQVKSSLNADAVNNVNEIKIQSVVQSSPTVQNSLQQLSKETGVADQSKLVEAATVQSILKEIGAPTAQVEYLDNGSQTKALMRATTQDTSFATTESLKEAAHELDQASKGSATVASQVDSYIKSSFLYKGLTSLAIPGIDQVAKSQDSQNTLNVKVLHVQDLNTQPQLDLSFQDGTAQKVTAIIIQDNYGNQVIKFTGLDQNTELAKRTAELEKRLQRDPAQFNQRVEEKLSL